ncbi:MAG: STAS domain-containing protein [Roseiflexaceae bacterium]
MNWLETLLTINHPDPNYQRRERMLAIILLAIIVLLIFFIPINLLTLSNQTFVVQVLIIMALEGGLLWLTRRGNVNLAGWLFTLLTVLSVISTVALDTSSNPTAPIYFLIFCIVTAGVVLPPRHMWGIMAACVAASLICLVVRPDLVSNPTHLLSAISITLILIFCAIISFLGSRGIDQALELANQNKQQALAAQQHAEQQANDLIEQAETLRRTEQQLQSLVATLETPTVPLIDGVLLAPIIGAIDSNRALNLTDRLLQDVSSKRIRLLVLDIAGVALIDTAVANTLIRIVQTVQLLGSQVVLTGVTPNVAITLTQLGVDFTRIRTARSPQEVLGAIASGEWKFGQRDDQLINN